MNRANYLQESTVTESEDEYPDFDALLDYEIKGEVDLKLIQLAFKSKIKD